MHKQNGPHAKNISALSIQLSVCPSLIHLVGTVIPSGQRRHHPDHQSLSSTERARMWLSSLRLPPDSASSAQSSCSVSASSPRSFSTRPPPDVDVLHGKLVPHVIGTCGTCDFLWRQRGGPTRPGRLRRCSICLCGVVAASARSRLAPGSTLPRSAASGAIAG